MVLSRRQADAKEKGPVEVLIENCQSEMEMTRRELKEISLMVEQSQLEVSKLTQRNASINAQLQQVQAQIENMPRGDVRAAYESALDSQQRLFVMRGQLDRLQSDKARLEKYQGTLDQVLKVLQSSAVPPGKGTSGAAETVEMIIRAQEAERQRLSRQMHDGPAQALSNFILQTEIASRLFEIDQAKAKEELANLKTSASSTFQKVRDFIFELRPMMLDDLGLAPTLNRYVEALKSQTNIDIRFNTSGMEERLESYIEVMIFRSVQELLGNVIRHSQATQVKVQMDAASGEVKVSVDDNGKGFNVETLSETTGMGLKVIKDRVDMIGGEMDIDSVPGQGTRVSFSMPAKIISAL
jgi:two-component system sensor histidine kinase DegS